MITHKGQFLTLLQNIKGRLLTDAVATCPSVSTRSIVPVGKYGIINVTEWAKYLHLSTTNS